MIIFHPQEAAVSYDVESDTFGNGDWEPIIPESGHATVGAAFAACERWQEQAAEDETESRFRVVQVKRTPVTRLTTTKEA